MLTSNLYCQARRAFGDYIALLITTHAAPAVATPQVLATIELSDQLNWNYVSVDPARLGRSSN